MENGRAIERRDHLIVAARAVLTRDGVGATTLRGVATEAGVPLATLQYTFPSKELMLGAVIAEVREEMCELLRSAGEVDAGLGHAVRRGLETCWQYLVVDHPELGLLHLDLVAFSMHTSLITGRQMDHYSRIVAWWCQEAAHNAGEACKVPFAVLGRLLVSSLLGFIVEHLSDGNQSRSREDLEATISMLTGLAGVAPAPRDG